MSDKPSCKPPECEHHLTWRRWQPRYDEPTETERMVMQAMLRCAESGDGTLADVMRHTE
jgi:hypothetical protein